MKVKQGEGTTQEQWLLLAHICEKAVPSSLALKPDDSVLPHMSLAFELLPSARAQDEGGHQRISPCPGHLRRMHRILSNSVMIIPRFHNQKLWELIFLTLEPWAGAPGVGLGPSCSLGGTSAAEIPLLIFKLTLECMTSPFCVSTSTMRLDVAFSACP